MKNPYVRKALAAGVMLSVAGGAFAQSSIEEVVVTSRKRAESLQEVPISVTALTEAQIEGAGIARPADFISLIPNITLVDSANVGDTQVEYSRNRLYPRRRIDIRVSRRWRPSH